MRGLDGLHVIPRDFQAVFDRRAHVFDDDVSAFHEVHEHCVTFLGFEIELHHPLVAVQILIVRPVAAADDLFRIAGDLLDAYDIGAPVGEMPDARRARTRDGQIQNQYAGERQRPRVSFSRHIPPVQFFIRRECRRP